MDETQKFYEIIRHMNRRLAENKIMHIRLNAEKEDFEGKFDYVMPESETKREMALALYYRTNPEFRPEGVYITPRIMMPNEFLPERVYMPRPFNELDEKLENYNIKEFDSIIKTKPNIELSDLYIMLTRIKEV